MFACHIIIQREGASRRIDVTCDVKGRDLGSAARELENKVKGLSFDRGYHPERGKRND